MNKLYPSILNGLLTDTHQVIEAGQYHLDAASTINFGSGLVITLSQSGSQTVSFSTPPTSAQTNHVEISNKFNCAPGDILTVAVTSAADADQPPSLVKTTINLRLGN